MVPATERWPRIARNGRYGIGTAEHGIRKSRQGYRLQVNATDRSSPTATDSTSVTGNGLGVSQVKAARTARTRRRTREVPDAESGSRWPNPDRLPELGE